jgi:nucleotide-binding universal stress UspA family protein
MEIETVLAPADGSSAATEACEYAAAVAERYGAGLHVLHVVGEETTRAIREGDLTEEDVVAESDRLVETVAEFLVEDTPVSHSTAYGFSQSRLSQHPGSVILDAADEVGADFVVLPREPVTGDPEAVIEKAAEYVLAYASQPVLSV